MPLIQKNDRGTPLHLVTIFLFLNSSRIYILCTMIVYPNTDPYPYPKRHDRCTGNLLRFIKDRHALGNKNNKSMNKTHNLNLCCAYKINFGDMIFSRATIYVYYMMTKTILYLNDDTIGFSLLF